MRTLNAAVLACLLFAPGVALAHLGQEHDATPAWIADWWLSALLAASALAYAAGLARLRRAGKAGVIGRWRAQAFAAGMLVLVVALLSPLDAMAEHSFAAHMTQHLLLMLVAPPLLVHAAPVLAWTWSLPPARRQALTRRWAGNAAPRRLLQVLLHPLLVWGAASFVLWFWHLPGPYLRALADEGVHTLEHACFFLTSLALFYLLFAPRGRARLGFGGALLLGVGFGIENGFLGAILTFSQRPFYVPAGLPEAAMQAALQDQQLAGLIMWVPASIVHLGLLGLLCMEWLRDEERRHAPAISRYKNG
ncbi:cytochrome c oxidase assembly protein [Massilia sp. UMI-21]|nr:cytochrome c oxidase assembly protein [Massilia sp. UMI-21]